MNDIIVNCARFQTQLSSWLDGELDAFSAAAMERHAADCARCAVLATDLRNIHAAAAALAPLAPSRDLWSGIQTRIAAPVIPIGTASTSAAAAELSSTAPARRRWLRPAAAAAALILMTAGVTHLLETRVVASAPHAARVASVPSAAQPFAPHDTAAAPRSATPVASDPVATAPSTVLASVGASTAVPEVYRVTGDLATHNVEQSYDGEITRLRAIVDHNRGNLDSATVAVLQRNLQVIDSAIVQCQRALKHDPGSHFLIQSLDNALRSKVELLRTTATLSS